MEKERGGLSRRWKLRNMVQRYLLLIQMSTDHCRPTYMQRLVREGTESIPCYQGRGGRRREQGTVLSSIRRRKRWADEGYLALWAAGGEAEESSWGHPAGWCPAGSRSGRPGAPSQPASAPRISGLPVRHTFKITYANDCKARDLISCPLAMQISSCLFLTARNMYTFLCPISLVFLPIYHIFLFSKQWVFITFLNLPWPT